MSFKIFWKKFIPFTAALLIGLVIVKIFHMEDSANSEPELTLSRSTTFSIEGRGASGGDSGNYSGDFGNYSKESQDRSSDNLGFEKEPLQILSMPIAHYTDTAREHQIVGLIRVRIVFLATGEIGSTTPVNYLPDGLPEQAVAAAKQIKFKPEIRDGKPVTVTKTVEYNFSIY